MLNGNIRRKLAMTLSAAQLAAGSAHGTALEEELASYEAYRAVVAETVGMVGDRSAQDLARKHGLQVMNVTWEDTGRFKGSSVGPNISDMTIQVAQIHPQTEVRAQALMPVIRYSNFEDKSADLSLKDFSVLVGNEKGKPPTAVNLKKLLDDPRRFLSKPGSWKGKRSSLLAPRDSKVLVSAQACFLPIPQGGSAEFTPALFNYQSYEGDPAVLSILATREGTSISVIENRRGDATGFGGQALYFNQNGERAPFTGKRLSDFKAEGGPQGPTAKAAGEEGLNMVLLIQVPLKQKNPRRYGSAFDGVSEGLQFAAAGMARGASNVEAAVIGHGKPQGPFVEMADLDIERDERFPIRVTVQFYKATSNGQVSEADMAELAAQIRRVYEQSDYVGSLVVDGPTKRRTEHDGPKDEPAGWWSDFLRQNPGWQGPVRGA
jgi:hypothetical protein